MFIAAGLLASASEAGAFQVTSSLPASGACLVSPTGTIVIAYDATVDAASLSEATIIVRGDLTGRHHPAALTSTSTAIYWRPAAAFRPGEQITFCCTTGVLAQGGAAGIAHQFDFSIAARGCSNFLFAAAYAAGTAATFTVDLGDFDGDGDLDLVAGGDRAPARILHNDGHGDYTLVQTLGSVSVYRATTADLNDDGHVDIVAGYPNPSIYLNDGSGLFTTNQILGTNSAFALASGDVDGDGDVDIIGGYVFHLIQLFRNDGNGHFTTNDSVSLSGAALSDLCFGDLDQDGDEDLVAVATSGPCHVFLNDGAGNFTPSQSLGNRYSAAAVGDVEGDGDLDIVAESLGNPIVFTNLGGGVFATNRPNGDSWTQDVDLCDIDGDGDLDLLSANNALGTARIRLNDGAGHFTLATSPLNLGAIFSIATGDLDGDGDLDLVAGSLSQSAWVLTHLQCQDGSDFDQDGIPDGVELTLPGLSPTNAADAASDSDGDGSPLRDELVAGTSWTDSNDFFRVRQCEVLGDVAVTFQSATGRVYSLERSETLPSWLSISNDLPGTGNSVTFLDVVDTTTRYYRVRTRLAP